MIIEFQNISGTVKDLGIVLGWRREISRKPQSEYRYNTGFQKGWKNSRLG
jgi:hypothetical protein